MTKETVQMMLALIEAMIDSSVAASWKEFRKSKKAILMKSSLENALGAQERDAYAHPEYLELLKGLKQAVEIEEKLRWDLIAAQARIEIWRSEQANMRADIRNTA